MCIPDGKVALDQVRYTSCPVGNEDWMLQASSINLDTKLQEGVAHHVIMRFKDVPIFYTPYISFPLGDERKSGLLFPSFGHSGNNGFELEVPYYFNLAPNYDLTLTPGVLSARGVQLGERVSLPDRELPRPDRRHLPAERYAAAQRSQLRPLHRHHRLQAGTALRHRHRERQRQQLLSRISRWAPTRPA